jgi:Tol biopolymer transport system component
LISDAETAERRRTSGEAAAHPQWLDDDRVAFLSRPAGGAGTAVLLMRVSTGVVTKWLEVDAAATGFAVHPTHQEIAFVAPARQGGSRIVVRDLRTGVERLVASGGEYEELRWRPDGSLLAWSGPMTGGGTSSNGVWVAALDRSLPRRVVKDGYAPAWSADGRAIYFARMRGGPADTGLWRIDLSGGEAVRVREWGRVPYFDLVGDRLVMAGHDAAAQIYEMRSRP